MSVARQVLFIQGAGAGTHDDWDLRLVESLRRELGDAWEVRYPTMPDEADPTVPAWSTAIRRALDELDDGAIAIGHSTGGSILIKVLAEQPPARPLAAVVLLAAPFVGAGGWPAETFALTDDLGARLPVGTAVHLVHGAEDRTVPPAHAERYARAIPQAQLHPLAGRDHQCNDDLGAVARLIETAERAGGDER